MKVSELIKELEKLPPYKIVEIGSPTDDFGLVKRVVEYPMYVEVQSDYDIHYD